MPVEPAFPRPNGERDRVRGLPALPQNATRRGKPRLAPRINRKITLLALALTLGSGCRLRGGGALGGRFALGFGRCCWFLRCHGLAPGFSSLTDPRGPIRFVSTIACPHFPQLTDGRARDFREHRVERVPGGFDEGAVPRVEQRGADTGCGVKPLQREPVASELSEV